MSGAILLALRVVATLIVFSLTGSLVLIALAIAAVLAIGMPVLDLFTQITGVSLSANTVAIGFMLFTVLTIIAVFVPMVLAAGLFAVLAFGYDRDAIWFAWLSGAVAVACILVMGTMISTSEEAPIILPVVHSVRDAIIYAAAFMLPAILATSIGWLASRPLHRVGSRA